MARPPTARTSVAAGIAAMFAVLVATSVARGQSPTFTVTWDAPAGDCPDEAYLRSAVDQLLGGEDPAGARVEARAHVERAAEGVWRVRLTTAREGAAGERVVESTSCRSLADATALIVALAIDPRRVAQNQAAPTPAPAATPAPTPAPPPPLAPAPTHTPSRFAAFTAISGDLGTLPQPAYGFLLGGALLAARARIEAYGSYWPSRHAHATSTPSAGGDVLLATGGARGCWIPLGGALSVAACPGLELGVLHGQGTSVRIRRSADGVWVAATALARLTWHLAASWGLFLDASLAVPLVRDQFELDDIGTIHRAAPAEGRAAFGPELRF
jgi:hypothetical protein